MHDINHAGIKDALYQQVQPGLNEKKLLRQAAVSHQSFSISASHR